MSGAMQAALLLLAQSWPAVCAAEAAPLVFGDARGWAVLSRDGRLLKRMTQVCGMRSDEVAVSSDLAVTVFTAWSATAENHLLYACDSGASEPRLLGEAIGYHAQPSFSRDGKWVFFVHHPKKGGPVGMHDPGASAQLYRVRADGSGLEALSNTKGCKLAPREASDGLVLMLHTTCDGPRTLEWVRLDDKAVVATAEEGQTTHWPDLAPGGRWLLFTHQGYDATQLVELDVKLKRKRVLWTLPAGYENTHCAWGERRESLLFQKAGAVWRVWLRAKPTEEKLLDLGESA